MPAQAEPHVTVSVVTRSDFAELLPLLRGYCDFYDVAPSDAALLALAEALVADPARDGVQVIARGSGRRAVGFATIYWSWSTARAARIGVMNDLFVVPEARGSGAAERLVRACQQQCARLGAATLSWQTAPDNLRAQRFYERIGATREQWVDYFIEVGSD